MEYPIDEIRVNAISRVTGKSYEDMMLVMLKWCAINLYNGIKFKHVACGMAFYDINENGIKTFSFAQLVYNTIPFKSSFKLNWSGVNFHQTNTFTFEKYMESLYNNLKVISNNFTTELVNPKSY